MHYARALGMVISFVACGAECVTICCDEHVNQIHNSDSPPSDILGECINVFFTHINHVMIDSN